MEMNAVFLEPLEDAEYREVIQRSRFFGVVRCVRNGADVKVIVSGTGERHRNATHICYAYRIGFPNAVEFSTDAGEPSGTAGRPILGALQRSGLTNCCVLIVRFFGGIKLGVRGLIEAYGSVASEAIRLAGQVSRIPARRCYLNVRYDHLAETMALLRKHDSVVETPEYAEDVRLFASVPIEQVDSLNEHLCERRARKMLVEFDWTDDSVVL